MKNAFQFQAQPRAVGSCISIDQSKNVDIMLYRNLMVDYRVIRGNTYSKHFQTKFQPESENELTLPKKFNITKNERLLNLNFPRTQNLFNKSKTKKQKTLIPIKMSRQQSNIKKDNKPNYYVSQGIFVDHNDRLQTNLPEFFDKSTMTEFIIEKKEHDLTYEFKVGEHKYTQVIEEELFDWNKEVQPIIQALKVRILEESLLEVQQQQELFMLKKVQNDIIDDVEREKQKQENFTKNMKKDIIQKKKAINAKRTLKQKKIDLHKKIVSKKFSLKMIQNLEKNLFLEREKFKLSWEDKFKCQFENKKHVYYKKIKENINNLCQIKKNMSQQVVQQNQDILQNHKNIVKKINDEKEEQRKQNELEQQRLQQERVERHARKRLQIKKQKVQALKNIYQKNIRPNFINCQNNIIVEDLQAIDFNDIQNQQQKIFVLGGIDFELETLFNWLQINENEFSSEKLQEILRTVLFQLKEKAIKLNINFEHDTLEFLEQNEIILDNLSLEQLQTIEDSDNLMDLLLQKIQKKNNIELTKAILKIHFSENMPNIQLQIEQEEEKDQLEDDEQEDENKKRFLNEQNMILLTQKLPPQIEEDEQSVESENVENNIQQQTKTIYDEEIYSLQNFDELLQANEDIQTENYGINQDISNEPKAKYFIYNFNFQFKLYQPIRDMLQEYSDEHSTLYGQHRNKLLKQKFEDFVQNQKKNLINNFLTILYLIMNKYILFFVLFNICFSECLKNCYLGEKFYSAPLDDKGCCRYDWNFNCEQFIEVSPDKYVCDRCRIGYRWVNNKCYKYKNKKCINPEMNLIPFEPCKICRFKNEQKYIPEYNPNTQQYKCKQYDEANLDRFAKYRLENCVASGAIGSSIFCYDCAKGHFMDWKTQSCIKQESETNSVGCKISTAANKCHVCHPEYQLDVFEEKCISRDQQINWEQAQQIDNPQIQKILANFNRENNEDVNVKEFIYQNPAIKQQMDNIKKIENVLNGLKDYIGEKQIGSTKDQKN